MKLPNRRRPDTAGQSTVELALMTPLVLMLLLWIAQFGIIFAQKITLQHVSRETARAVAVYNSAEVAAEAARSSSSLSAERLEVTVLGEPSPGSVFTVQVSYRAATEVPLVGELLGDFTLTSQTSMRAEGRAPPAPSNP